MCPKPIAIISFCVALISNLLNSLNVVKYSFLSSMGKFSFQDCTCYLSCILPVNYWLIDSAWDMCDEWDASFNSSAYFTSQFVVKYVLYTRQGWTEVFFWSISIRNTEKKYSISIFRFFFSVKEVQTNGRRKGAKALKRSNSKTNSQIGCLAINMN